jgi:hypothetical protein
MPLPTYDTTGQILSQSVLNELHQPPIQNDSRHIGGVVRVAMDTLVISEASTTAVHRFFSLPSSASLKSVFAWHKTDLAVLNADIGLYHPLGSIGAGVLVTSTASTAAVNNIQFASVRSGTVAAAPQEGIFSGVNEELDPNQMLWEKAGLSADPSQQWDIGMILNDAGIAGSVTLRILYTDI